MNYNFFNTLIFSGIIYGFVFSITTSLNKEYKSKARFFLVLTVLSMTLSNLQYWIIDIGLREMYNVPKVIYVQFELLIVPFFYHFVRNYLDKGYSKKVFQITLIPFVLGMFYQISTYVIGVQKPDLTKYNLIVETLTILYSLSLISLIVREIFSYSRYAEREMEKSIMMNTRWLSNTMFVGVFVFIIWIISTQLFYVQGLHSFKTYYPLWLGISAVIYWIGNKGVVELRIKHEREVIREKRSNSSNDISIRDKKLEGKGKLLFEKIIKDVRENHIYLDPNLSLQALAKKYDISSGYLSQLINTYLDGSFPDLINNLRIEEAKRMLQDNAYDNYTINAITLESGFNSKSNFYSVFKKVEKMTPNQYKKVRNM